MRVEEERCHISFRQSAASRAKRVSRLSTLPGAIGCVAGWADMRHLLCTRWGVVSIVSRSRTPLLAGCNRVAHGHTVTPITKSTQESHLIVHEAVALPQRKNGGRLSQRAIAVSPRASHDDAWRVRSQPPRVSPMQSRFVRLLPLVLLGW